MLGILNKITLRKERKEFMRNRFLTKSKNAATTKKAKV